MNACTNPLTCTPQGRTEPAALNVAGTWLGTNRQGRKGRTNVQKSWSQLSCGHSDRVVPSTATIQNLSTLLWTEQKVALVSLGSTVKQSWAVNIWENENAVAMSLLHTLTGPSQVFIFAHTFTLKGRLCRFPSSAMYSGLSSVPHMRCWVGCGYVFVVWGALILAGQGFPGVAGERKSVHTL